MKANLGQRDAQRSYGLDGEDLTAALGWNLPALRRAWNTAKAEVAPWWSECSCRRSTPDSMVWPVRYPRAARLGRDLGEYIIWGFNNQIAAHSSKVTGFVPDCNLPLTSYQVRLVSFG